MGFFEHEDGWEGTRQDQRNAELEQEWLRHVYEKPLWRQGEFMCGVNTCPEADDMCWKFQSVSQPTVPVFSHDHAKVGVPVMWNNKMSAIQDLLNAIPSEGDDPVDLYRWLDRYDQLHYEAESICNYAQGMHVTIPELTEAVKVSMAAADLVIAKLQLLHREYKPQMMAPRIFMVPPGAWVPSNMEGYGNRPKQAWRQTEKVAVGSSKGKQKMTQDDEDEDEEGADNHEDDQQGGSNDNDKALENLDGPCNECSGEGRGASCEGEPQQWGSVNELQELFKGGFLAMVTGLLQDKEMPVIPEEIPVVKEESPIKIIPQETLGRTSMSPSPLCGPSSSPARTMPWLHTLDEQIKRLEEIIEMNEIEVVGMHEDLARVTAWVSRFRSVVLEQCH
ncbi:hypothetical protein EDC04DRAFT_2596970 [Pisolithus marmoratus]|nr:hypothetical protein EDC04DRAFT_2596970 [Pisolithus marmoratus]